MRMQAGLPPLAETLAQARAHNRSRRLTDQAARDAAELGSVARSAGLPSRK